MRTPIEILEQVRECLPNDIRIEYDPKLDSIKSSIEFSSPDNKGFHVRRFMTLFNEILGNKPLTKESEDWKFKALAVYMGETIEETRKKFGNSTTVPN